MRTLALTATALTALAVFSCNLFKGKGGHSDSDTASTEPANAETILTDASISNSLAIDSGPGAGTVIDLPPNTLAIGSKVEMSAVEGPAALTIADVPPASAAVAVTATDAGGAAIEPTQPFTIALVIDTSAALAEVEKIDANLCALLAGVGGELYLWRNAALAIAEGKATLKTLFFGTFQLAYCGSVNLSNFNEVTSSGTLAADTVEAPGVFKLTVPAGTLPSRNVTVSWSKSANADDVTVSIAGAAGCASASAALTKKSAASAGKVTIKGVPNGTHFVCAKAVNAVGATSATDAKVTIGQVLVGQSSYISNPAAVGEPPTYGAAKARIGWAWDAKIVGTKLIVADNVFNRVLIWNKVPNSNGEPADLVLGQENFTGSAENRTGSTSAPARNSLYLPTSIASDGTRLVVADSGNKRILIWNTFPTTNGQAADLVLGTASFILQGGGSATQSNVGAINSVAIADGKLLASGSFTVNRVLIWNDFPTSNNAPADVVIGQSDFTGSGAIESAAGLSAPSQMVFAGGALWLADYSHHRILRYNSIPTTNGASASFQLGQVDFNSAAEGLPASASTFFGPGGVAVYDGKLIVADSDNQRILVWNALPTASNKAADAVIGQPDFTSNDLIAPPTSTSVRNPYQIQVVDGTLVVPDNYNGRVILRPFP